jgi:hypothetical protein
MMDRVTLDKPNKSQRHPPNLDQPFGKPAGKCRTQSQQSDNHAAYCRCYKPGSTPTIRRLPDGLPASAVPELRYNADYA